MKSKRTLIAGLSAMLVVAALVAVYAVVSPMSTQAASDAAPVIKVKYTGEKFNVSWTVPEGVTPTEQIIETWTDNGFRRTSSGSIPFADTDREWEFVDRRELPPGTAHGFRGVDAGRRRADPVKGKVRVPARPDADLAAVRTGGPLAQ